MNTMKPHYRNILIPKPLVSGQRPNPKKTIKNKIPKLLFDDFLRINFTILTNQSLISFIIVLCKAK